MAGRGVQSRATIPSFSGIEFISYQENIDTGSPLGKAMFTIVAAIAQLERNIIVERIRGGIRRAKEQGK